MNKQEYTDLRREFAKSGWLKGSNGFAFLIFAFEILFLTAGFYILFMLEPWSFTFILVQILLATSIFRFFVLLHDCGHYSLFASRRLNTIFGNLAGIIALTPFVCWRDVHFEHHRWVGVKDKDPTAAGLVDFEDRQQHSNAYVALLRGIWWLRLPVPSILFTVQVIWGYPLRLLRKGEAGKAKRAFASLILSLVPHCLLIGVWGIDNYAIYVLPVLLISYIWYELINLTHHAGLYHLSSAEQASPVPLYEQPKYSRSAQMPSWLSFVLCYHFNLHTEHHLFPAVPFHHLPKVQAVVKSQSDGTYNGVSFPGFNQRLRQADPVDVLLNQLPDHLERL